MDEETLIRYIAENLVNDAAQVVIERHDTPKGDVVELRVAQEDMGRVIGKNGRVANAMRTILRVAGEKAGAKRVTLEIE